MSDGELRQAFSSHLRDFHWQAVETWSTGQGVPDVNFCFGGVEGWIENKSTSGWVVDLSPSQIGWIERRIRNGGRVFIAVRRLATAGPRKGAAVDELYLFPGFEVRALADGGLDRKKAIGVWSRGPAKWDWATIRLILTKVKVAPKVVVPGGMA